MSASGPVLSSKTLGGELARDMQVEQRRTAEEIGQGRGRGGCRRAERCRSDREKGRVLNPCTLILSLW